VFASLRDPATFDRVFIDAGAETWTAVVQAPASGVCTYEIPAVRAGTTIPLRQVPISPDAPVGTYRLRFPGVFGLLGGPTHAGQTTPSFAVTR
jgi:hypothetical protein